MTNIDNTAGIPNCPASMKAAPLKSSDVGQEKGMLGGKPAQQSLTLRTWRNGVFNVVFCVTFNLL